MIAQVLAFAAALAGATAIMSAAAVAALQTDLVRELIVFAIWML